MNYYEINVKILVEAKSADSAKDIVENVIDDAVQNINEFQDYEISVTNIIGIKESI
jgi:hypothetical protein